MLCFICPLEEQGHLHQLPLQWDHLKREAHGKPHAGQMLCAEGKTKCKSPELWDFF